MSSDRSIRGPRTPGAKRGPRIDVLVALRPPAGAKTRLDIPASDRAALAYAMAVDTVTAVLATGIRAVHLLCCDASVRRRMQALPVKFLADEPAGDVNAAFQYGLAQVRRTDGISVLMTADLPALTATAVASAVAAVDRQAGVVADAAGVGTTMLVMPSEAAVAPRFGSGSFAAHVGQGAVAIDVPGLSPLRRDIDTLDDLAAAEQLGLGPATRRALADLRMRRVIPQAEAGLFSRGAAGVASRRASVCTGDCRDIAAASAQEEARGFATKTRAPSHG